MSNKKSLENKYEYASFWRSAFAIHGSITPRVMKPVLLVVIYAIFISILHDYFFLWDEIPVSPFEYAGLVMGLILVFRINAGHDRWWEARKLWGTVVNSSRNLGMICTEYTKNTSPDTIKKLVGCIAAQPFLMKNNLRQDDSIEEVKHLVDEKTAEMLTKKAHKPNFIAQKIAYMLGELTQSEQLDSFAFLQAEKHRSEIVDCQGACERILKTPMPFVMAIKSRRFILLFLLMLPIALAEHSAYVNLLVTVLVSYALLSLDRIGVELQNPFSHENLSHLPLDNICHTINTNLDELLNTQEEDNA